MKSTNSSRLNMNIALKSLLLIGYAVFFLHAIYTGDVRSYVHPRIIPFLIFAAAVMIIMALLFLTGLFRVRAKKDNTWTLLFFIIPLIMAFALPVASLSSGTGTKGDVQLSGTTGASGNTAEPVQESQTTGYPAESLAESAASDTSDNASASPDEGLKLQNGVLVLDSSNYYECLCDIYENMDKYLGTKIEVVGFVFKENEEFTDDEFVAARLMMTCCAADMQTEGLLCIYDKAGALKPDSWVKVTGTISKTEFGGESIPCIDAESVTSIDKPDEEYIYPY